MFKYDPKDYATRRPQGLRATKDYANNDCDPKDYKDYAMGANEATYPQRLRDFRLIGRWQGLD